GEITPDQVASHPMRNVLTQSVGTCDELAIQLLDLWLEPADRVLMTSDGVHGVIGDEEILEILALANQPSETVHELISATRKHGAPDNTSSIVIDYLGND